MKTNAEIKRGLLLNGFLAAMIAIVWAVFGKAGLLWLFIATLLFAGIAFVIRHPKISALLLLMLIGGQ